MKISDQEYRIMKSKIDVESFEDCVEYYDNEGVCGWCLGEKEVSADVDDGEGHIQRGVGTEKCPVCTNRNEPDSDYYNDLMLDK
jgi:hypothetical protein